MRTGRIDVIITSGYSGQFRKMGGLLSSLILLLMLLLLPSITVAETAANLQAAIAGTDGVSVSPSGPSSTQTWFEEDDPAIAYTGTWNSFACPACVNGFFKYSGQTGAKAEFSFYGTGLRWTTAKAPVLGKAKIYLNGVYKGIIDLYSPVVEYPIVLEGKGLPPDNYTLTIEVSDQKNPGSTGYYTLIDAFEAIPANVLSLDGVDDKTTATTTIFPNTSTAQSFTVEAWIYPTSYGDAHIAADDAYDLELDYYPGAANSGLGINFRLWSTCSSSKSQTEYRDVTLNQWNHVAGIFDASAQQFKISINGILSSSPVTFTASTFCSDTAQHFEVGGFYNSSYTFEGKIDEVRVSDTIRYTSGFTPVGYFTSDANTKGLWHFDESAGSTSFSDSSGNGNTLTGLNGAQTGTAP